MSTHSETEHTLKLSTPVDILAAVPYLLGFHPTDSLVVLGIGPGRGRVCFTGRCDLPQGDAPSAARIAESLVGPLQRENCHHTVVVGYGPARRVTPCVDTLSRRLERAGIGVQDALRVSDGRYWSYVCRSPRCCPPEGTPYDPDLSTVPAAAVMAGLNARADRAELAASIAPVVGERRARMERATRRAEARCLRSWGISRPEGRIAGPVTLQAEGVRVVREVVSRALRDELPETPDELAWLGVLLRAVRVRDEAWAHIHHETVERHVRLWSHVSRHVTPAYVAAPGSLLAFAAWQSGEGALANVALDRVESVVPDYSMAALIRQALLHGISPRKWHHFSPEWLDRQWPVPVCAPAVSPEGRMVTRGRTDS